MFDKMDIAKIRIEQNTRWKTVNLIEIWNYRELLFFLAWRDIKVKYKQTLLGVAWVIIQPLITMAIFTVIFGRLAKISSEGVPYPVFCFCALLPWNYFAGSLSRASGSLIGNTNLITKVYFPRLIIPLSSLLSGFLDFAVAFIFLIGLMFWYNIHPTVSIFWFPVFLFMAIAASTGVGLWLCALNVQYRDINQISPFLIQVWMYLTPIVYPSSMIPERFRLLYGLNPMVGIIEGFRWSLLNQRAPSLSVLLISAAAAAILLLSGAFYFRNVEKYFADII